jgi:hypothetical protein
VSETGGVPLAVGLPDVTGAELGVAGGVAAGDAWGFTGVCDSCAELNNKTQIPAVTKLINLVSLKFKPSVRLPRGTVIQDAFRFGHSTRKQLRTVVTELTKAKMNLQ